MPALSAALVGFYIVACLKSFGVKDKPDDLIESARGETRYPAILTLSGRAAATKTCHGQQKSPHGSHAGLENGQKRDGFS